MLQLCKESHAVSASVSPRLVVHRQRLQIAIEVMRVLKRLLAATAACLLLVSCGGEDSTPPAEDTAPPPTTAGSTAEEPSPATEESAEPAEPAEDGLTKGFGTTLTWDDGVQFTLSQPNVVEATETMSMFLTNEKLDEFVVMDATLVNGTAEPLSPMMINTQATTGEIEAEAVFDSASGIGMPTADILPGKSSQYKVAFARMAGQEFVVSVSNMNDMLSDTQYYEEGAPVGPAIEPTAAAPSGEPAENALIKSFGTTLTWQDGLEFTLSEPTVIEPSEVMSMLLSNQALDEFVVMDATLVNGTSEPLSPMMINTQATTGEIEAEALFDTGMGIDMPTADILPGKTSQFKVAYARMKGQEFVVSVSNMNDIMSDNQYYQ